jgi:N-methylhydantoinase B/oxoprolinase/acetone carboxylase alpha subunit
VERADGTRTSLTYADETPMDVNDVFVIETPGGGGYGELGVRLPFPVGNGSLTPNSPTSDSRGD